MNENKKEQLAKNLSWMCKREVESGGKGESLCPCLPQNSCPWDIEGKTCPATYQDWLEWMNKEDEEEDS